MFELQAHTPGYLVNLNDSRPLLKILPTDSLMGEVYITNRDIGFVEPGMVVDVRVDSFPFSEFGDVKGQLAQIGSDALLPDATYNFFRFPAKVRLSASPGTFTIGDEYLREYPHPQAHRSEHFHQFIHPPNRKSALRALITVPLFPVWSECKSVPRRYRWASQLSGDVLRSFDENPFGIAEPIFLKASKSRYGQTVN